MMKLLIHVGGKVLQMNNDALNQRKKLAHNIVNIYQVEMSQLDQHSFVVPQGIAETAPLSLKPIKIFVKDENVLYRIQHLPQEAKIGVMNFANPVEPGGGFLLGINAQEQALCRNTFLYPELLKHRQTYYLQNFTHNHDFLYSDALIYAQNIKVLRDEKEDQILPYFKYVDIITIAAPNLRRMKQQHLSLDYAKIKESLTAKILATLRMFKEQRCDYLILGAFGCGSFENDPQQVAQIFAECLKRTEFLGAFKEVYFDILGDEHLFQVFQAKLLTDFKG